MDSQRIFLYLPNLCRPLTPSLSPVSSCSPVCLWSTRLTSHRLQFAENGQTRHSTNTVLHCAALHCTALYWTVLYCTVLHWTVLYCTELYCTVLYCTAPYYTVLYCTALYYTALYCTKLYSTGGGNQCLVTLPSYNHFVLSLHCTIHSV